MNNELEKSEGEKRDKLCDVTSVHLYAQSAKYH